MTQPTETRPSLIVRLKNARDDAAWAEFLSLYEPVILRLLQRLGLKIEDARDVCQQVLASVAKDVEQWKSDDKPASFRRWLFQIARNRAIKFLVKERARIVAAGGTDAILRIESQAEAKSALSSEFEREYRQQLLLYAAEQIRAEFRESTWQAFWRTCIEGRSVAEISRELGMSPGNIYVARSRIVARLRARVSEVEAEN